MSDDSGYVVADIIECACGVLVLRFPDGRKQEVDARVPLFTGGRPHLHILNGQKALL